MDDVADYPAAVKQMVSRLTQDGQLDAAFAARLEERERKGTMVFGNSVAIPHSVQYASDKLVLAVGVVPQAIEHKGKEIRVIFLLGLPRLVQADDTLLIRVYDEIISITKDTELLNKVSAAATFSDLLRVLYRNMGVI